MLFHLHSLQRAMRGDRPVPVAAIFVSVVRYSLLLPQEEIDHPAPPDMLPADSAVG
jgi:hypothetical protein